LGLILQEIVINANFLLLPIYNLGRNQVLALIIDLLSLSDPTLFGRNRIIERVFMRSNLIQVLDLISMSVRDQIVSVGYPVIAFVIIVFWEVHPVNVRSNLPRIRPDRFSEGVCMRLSGVRLSERVIGDDSTIVSEPNGFFEHIEKAVCLP
jgi:hypothetical protein